MPRKPKHSGDNPSPDKNTIDEDIIIEGTAEHIRNDSADNKRASDQKEANQAETENKAKPASPKRRHFGRALWVILLWIGILAALAAAGLAISNRLLIQQQQDANAVQDISSRTDNIETTLNGLEEKVLSLNDALEQSQTAQGANADLLNDIPSRLTAMQDQINRMNEIITSWQGQLSETPNSNPDPDLMIVARQLAEMEQRLLNLEVKLLSPSADLGVDNDAVNPAPQDLDEDALPSVSPPLGNTPAELSAVTDAIIIAARQGEDYANLLESAVNTDIRWNALEPWAKNPPPAREDLWQDLAARGDQVFVTASSPETIPTENDSSWWSWLTSPFSDTVTIAPIDPGAEAKVRFVAALENRDHIAAIAELTAWAGEEDNMTIWIGEWQRQFNQRQDLDDALANLIMILDQ